MEARLVNKMFASIAPRYDVTNTVLSFGIHHLWRGSLVRMLPPSRDLMVLDLCTGTGDLLPILRKRFGRAVGADFCYPMLEVAQAKENKAGKENKTGAARSSLLQGDALNLPFRDATFDIVSVAFGVRNFENPETGLKEISRVLKKGGHLLVLEFGQPVIPGVAAFYRFYSNHLMPFIGGFLTGNREAYRYLPKTAGEFPCRGDFTAVLGRCGFANSRYKTLSAGIAYAYCAEKR